MVSFTNIPYSDAWDIGMSQEKLMRNIMSIENIKSYLDNRPKLIDVSIEPKLVINGIPHPTGVKKT